MDAHSDPDHHRSVLTLAGDPDPLGAAVLALARGALATIDLANHAGAHPRLGALDVVPFAPLYGRSLAGAVAAREAAIQAIGALGIPVFRFGPVARGSLALPELRRRAFRDLAPDAGPPEPHPTAGATAVGARPPLVAWNAWLQGASLAETRRAASAVRSRAVRALGLQVAGATQVSCNLLDPAEVTPLDVYRLVEAGLPTDAHIVRCELVGLVPGAVLEAVPRTWWERLDLDEDRAVERRAEAAGVA